jgi:Flp pilus assembly protein TadG
VTNGKLRCKELITRLLHGDAGQSLVEIALTLPVLIALLVGAAEFASVAYVAIEVSNAAKAAVAYGAQSPTTVSDTTGIQNAAILDASNITLTSSNVTVSTLGVCSSGASCTGAPNNTTCTNTDCQTNAGDHIETILTVGTSYTFKPAVHLPGLPASYTLRGHATQICLPQ